MTTNNKLAKHNALEIVKNTLNEYVQLLKDQKTGLKIYKGKDLTNQFEQIDHLLKLTKDERSLDEIICDIVLDRINFLKQRGIGDHEIAAHEIYLSDLGFDVTYE